MLQWCIFCQKLVGLGGSLDFNSPKTWCWHLLGSILAVQKTFSNNRLIFGWGYTFLSKDWSTGYKALSSSLKCYAGSANLRMQLKYTSSYFSPIFMHFWIKSQCLSPTLAICLKINFIPINRNVDLGDILHPEEVVTRTDFENSISLSQIKIWFLHLGFWKRILSKRLNPILAAALELR